MVYLCGRDTLNKRGKLEEAKSKVHLYSWEQEQEKELRPKPHGAILLITVTFMTTKAIMKQRLKRKIIYLIRLTDMTGKNEKSYLHTLSLFQLFCDESNSNSS